MEKGKRVSVCFPRDGGVASTLGNGRGRDCTVSWPDGTENDRQEGS